MNFFKYLIANRLWYFLGFMAFVGVFVYTSSFFGELGSAVKWVSIACGVLTVMFLIGNYVAWKRSR